MLIDEAGQPDRDIGERCLRENGDAVVALLPGERCRILRRLDFHQRKLRVLALGFPRETHVDQRLCVTIEEMRKPDLEAVDVPGREFHLAAANVISSSLAEAAALRRLRTAPALASRAV